MLLRRGTRAFAAQAHPPPLFDGQAATLPGASAALSPDSFFLRFVNHEARGVPAGAAADGPSGFPLARMEALLEALGSPHAQYPVVHVGGSKGKGSVVALVSAALRANGLSVATYTSPHAFESRERLTLGLSSGPVPAREWAEHVARRAREGVVERVEQEAGPLTHFEVLTALALDFFAHGQLARPDVAVVEVGLGGARDATNVFARAGSLEVAAVAALDLEHLSALGGDTIQHVARVKAGIFGAGRPAVIAPQFFPGALAALEAAARAAGAQVILPGRFRVDPFPTARSRDAPPAQDSVRVRMSEPGAGAEGGTIWTPGRTNKVGRAIAADVVPPGGHAFRMRLQGEHQQRNAETALAILRAMATGAHCAAWGRVCGPGRAPRSGPGSPRAWHFSHRRIARGLGEAALPGRFHIVRRENQPTLIADGAHTPGAAAALAATLRSVVGYDAVRGMPWLTLVLAVAADKPLPELFAPLAALRPGAVFATSAPVAGSGARSAPAEEVARAWDAEALKVPGTWARAPPEWFGPDARRPERSAVQSEEGPPFNCVYAATASRMGDLRSSLVTALASGSRDGVVCVTGSLHAAFLAVRLAEERAEAGCEEAGGVVGSTTPEAFWAEVVRIRRVRMAGSGGWT